MAPWLGLRAAYSKFFIAGAAFLFESLGPSGGIRFRQSTDSKHDIDIIVYNRDQIGPDGKVPLALRANYSSHYAGYIHTVFITALILATPISFRRRVWALVLALILMHVFIAFKLLIMLISLLSNSRLSLFVLSPFWKDVVVTTNQVVVRHLTTGFIIAFFIWILVSFRGESLLKFLTQSHPTKT